MTERHQKLIIDTDCGVDDAFALLLALGDHSPAEVLAVTCTYGNTSVDNAVSNVMRIITLCNKKEIPVYRGCDGPLSFRDQDMQFTRYAKSVHGKDGLGNCAHQFPTGGVELQSVPAVAGLVELTRKYPGEITLVAVGPMTNVALAHRLDPQFTARLKALYIMGGNYKSVGNVTEVAEFNFHCDPEAADIVVGETMCQIVMVPWETTVEFAIVWDKYLRLVEVQTPKGELIKAISKIFADRFKKDKKIYDCDLLAVAALLYPESVTDILEKSLAVESDGKLTRGLTVKLHDSNPLAAKRRKVKIVTAFDLECLDLDQLRFGMLQS